MFSVRRQRHHDCHPEAEQGSKVGWIGQQYSGLHLMSCIDRCQQFSYIHFSVQKTNQATRSSVGCSLHGAWERSPQLVLFLKPPFSIWEQMHCVPKTGSTGKCGEWRSLNATLICSECDGIPTGQGRTGVGQSRAAGCTRACASLHYCP